MNFSPGTSKKTTFRLWPRCHSCHQHNFTLSHLQDLPQIHRPVEVSPMCCESGVDGIGIGNGDGYTRSPMRGCFSRGSVVSLSCVGFDIGSNTGKKGVVSNSTVGCLTSSCSIDVGNPCCNGALTGVCPTCSFRRLLTGLHAISSGI